MVFAAVQLHRFFGHVVSTASLCLLKYCRPYIHLYNIITRHLSVVGTLISASQHNNRKQTRYIEQSAVVTFSSNIVVYGNIIL